MVHTWNWAVPWRQCRWKAGDSNIAENTIRTEPLLLLVSHCGEMKGTPRWLATDRSAQHRAGSYIKAAALQSLQSGRQETLMGPPKNLQLTEAEQREFDNIKCAEMLA